MNNDTGRGAAAAVHSIDHFALNVPSVDAADHFFRHFGLDVSSAGASGDERELRAADGHRWGRILPAQTKSLAYLSLNCFAGDLAAIEAQVRKAGGSFDVDPALANADGFAAGFVDGFAEGFWFHDLDGNLIQVKAGIKTSPFAKQPAVFQQAPADARGSYPRESAQTVRPRRLSHVLFFTPDVLRAVTFYEQALGLRLSDKSLDIIAFTHAPHGSDHHLIAFAKSHAKGWHHVAWDVASVNEVGVGAAQMAAAGYVRGWGTGRHVLGSNYFHYIQDPWGSFSEYSFDIDFVSAGSAWPAGDFLPENSLYLWGPDVPDYFIFNTEGREILEGTEA
jgi:catechol 2,3-dioxygenase-like lactoylglutathione lyase family enzyme